MAYEMTDLHEAASIRSDGDSWEITESVGATALGVAAARAVETARDDALIRDEFAYLLVARPGRHGPRWPASDPDWLADDEDGRRLHEMSRDYQAVRTHYFDEYFHAVDAGGHPPGGDPGGGAGLTRLPAELAGGHHGVRDRPAQGARVQDLDA